MNRNFRINGETVAASQEGALVIELFLNDNYRFRRNVLNGKVEFMTLPEGEGASWRPLTQEALNSIILRAERENIMEKGSPNAKIKMYVQSEEVPVFNPVAAFIWKEPCGLCVQSHPRPQHRAAQLLGHLDPFGSGALVADGHASWQ